MSIMLHTFLNNFQIQCKAIKEQNIKDLLEAPKITKLVIIVNCLQAYYSYASH